MFIDLLTEEEQRFFLKSALEIEGVTEKRCELTQSKVDTFVHRIVGESGGDVEELNIDSSKIERPLAKKVILLELISIGYASGDYCDDEKAYVRKVANDLGVNLEKVEQIESWGLEFFNQIGQGVNIVNN